MSNVIKRWDLYGWVLWDKIYGFFRGIKQISDVLTSVLGCSFAKQRGALNFVTLIHFWLVGPHTNQIIGFVYIVLDKWIHITNFLNCKWGIFGIDNRK